MKTYRTRRQNRDTRRPTRRGLTLGELIATAYDRLGTTRAVVDVLRHTPVAVRNGRRVVFP